jgi:hypothetical protein
MILTPYLYWYRSKEQSLNDNIHAATTRFKNKQKIAATKIIVNPLEYEMYKELNLRNLKIIEDKSVQIGCFGIQ